MIMKGQGTKIQHFALNNDFDFVKFSSLHIVSNIEILNHIFL